MLQQRQSALRALTIARSTLDQRRSCMRIRLAIPVEVTCPNCDPPTHKALVRDISTAGAFFYSNFTPDLHCRISLDFTFPVNERMMKVSCSGRVVRVEGNGNGGATGIAMQFRHYDVAIC